MKNRYDNNPSKDVARANVRYNRLEAEHSSANSFVKAEQSKIKAKGGKSPKMPAECSNFDACMTSDGMHAQEFARSLTKGLDKDAFPVK